MNQLKVETLCKGIMAVRSNAQALTEEAKLLVGHGRLSRAYALSYMACEEIGKTPIL